VRICEQAWSFTAKYRQDKYSSFFPINTFFCYQTSEHAWNALIGWQFIPCKIKKYREILHLNKGSFRYAKSANFLGVPVRKIRLCKHLFTNLNYSMTCYICKEKKHVFAEVFQPANHKKAWVRKSQIWKVPHFRKVHKINKSYKSAKLRICDLQCAHLWSY
jgi:hypothetical protein